MSRRSQATNAIHWNNLVPPNLSQGDMVRMISDALSSGPLTDADKGVLSRISRGATRTRFFCGSDSGRRSCTQIMELLLRSPLDPGTGLPYAPRDFPYQQAFAARWEEVVSGLAPEELDVFRRHLRTLLSDDRSGATPDTSCEARRSTGAHLWSYGEDLSLPGLDLPAALGVRAAGPDEGAFDTAPVGRDPFDGRSLPDLLATLSLVASTYYLWEHYDSPGCTAPVDHLASLILPGVGAGRPDASCAPDGALAGAHDARGGEGAGEQDLLEDDRIASAKLARARSLLSAGRYAEAYRSACDLLETCYFAQDKTRGDALYVLGCCCETDVAACPVPGAFLSVGDVFREAYFHGCGEARRQVTSPDILRAPRAPDAGQAADDFGTCVANCENDLTSLLRQTMPATTGLRVLTSFSGPSLSSALDAGAHGGLRVVLLDDDLERNVLDALAVLDLVQHGEAPGGAEADAPVTEVVVRCDEELASPVIDTALNLVRSSNPDALRTVRVFLVDDAHEAALGLLVRHPPFYRLTSKAVRESADDQTLHVVVLSSNADASLASWLVREAFALPVCGEGVTTKVSVLSPHASGLYAALGAKCPGMSPYSRLRPLGRAVRDGGEATGGELPFADDGLAPIELAYSDVDLSSPALTRALEGLEATGDLLYYVVDTGSDLGNLSLAAHVRETSVRCAVAAGRTRDYAATRPVIAVPCSDPSLASLGANLMVPKGEEHANQWFNNYGFVTFGSPEERYAWPHLGRDAIERAAECVHLVYCGTGPAADGRYEELDGYFGRLYHRDSSRACAASLPYRLFAAGVFPEAWYVQDAGAWWDADARRLLARAFEDRLRRSARGGRVERCLLLKELERIEHVRWRRHMQSRGWVGMCGRDGRPDPYQAVQCIRNGAPSHMVQIAKVHPCICSWDELEGLQRQLDYEYHASEYAGARDGEAPRPDERFARYRRQGEEFDLFQSLDAGMILATADILRLAWFPVP